ncbi:hypothetical protein MCUN1_000914 [Malassezia cuniculi]|uniref:NECAP PHear domain-containing protein n=1 Tax=Malassezia cuniculi TaxID=948313 RepID=A0AAF0ET64_9BASI|nr:hypothetical protein MCUN1_000914 [Malassezia cuniculi]
MDDYSAVLYTAKEVYVYRVPPRTSTAGCRAAEWGDMEKYMWKGRLRIIERSEECEIRLEDSDSGQLFAASPYDVKGLSVEATLDSSRCFVLRVESDAPDGSRRKAYIGIAFRERSESFDFNVALQDWTRRYKAAHAPPQPAASEATPNTSTPSATPSAPAPARQDFSLKDGEMLSIKLPALGKREGSSGGSDPVSRPGFVLPPPPRR